MAVSGHRADHVVGLSPSGSALPDDKGHLIPEGTVTSVTVHMLGLSSVPDQAGLWGKLKAGIQSH